MNYKDRWETDENGEKFLFTVEMQRRLDEAGLPIEPASLAELSDTSGGRGNGRSQSGSSQSRSRRQADEPAGPVTVQIDPETGKYIGRLKWYNMKKGYGFIVRSPGEEIFFHKSNLSDNPQEMQEGRWVLYDLEQTHKGPEATEVEVYAGDIDQLA